MEKSENKDEICCTLNTSQMEERKKILREFRQFVKEKLELENGFQFEFDSNNEVMDRIFGLVKLERQCCAFLTFDLTVRNEINPIYLKITGPEGTKDFLLHELEL
jgi:hypothetical protein